MKTIPQRADEFFDAYWKAERGPEEKNAAERVLRELVEEIVDSTRRMYDSEGNELGRYTGASRVGEEIRRRFLGAPSAEEVGREALRGLRCDGEVSDTGAARIVVEALRKAGLLKEGASE